MANSMVDRILSVEPQVSGRKKGTAPAIRRLKEKYPEMSNSAIARRVGCHPTNVDRILRRYLGDATPEELRGYQENRADIYDAIGHRALRSISDEKMAKASPAELTTVFGILYDKSRLERGQATGINVSALMDVVEAMRSKPMTINAIAPNPPAIREPIDGSKA